MYIVSWGSCLYREVAKKSTLIDFVDRVHFWVHVVSRIRVYCLLFPTLSLICLLPCCESWPSRRVWSVNFETKTKLNLVPCVTCLLSGVNIFGVAKWNQDRYMKPKLRKTFSIYISYDVCCIYLWCQKVTGIGHRACGSFCDYQYMCVMI